MRSAGMREQLLHFALGEIGNGENPRRSFQRAMGQVKMQRAPESRLVAGPIHVIQHVMNGHHIRTGQVSRQPEQVRNMHQVAVQALEDGAKVEIVLDGVSSFPSKGTV